MKYFLNHLFHILIESQIKISKLKKKNCYILYIPPIFQISYNNAAWSNNKYTTAAINIKYIKIKCVDSGMNIYMD